jgi:hypothetical protein
VSTPSTPGPVVQRRRRLPIRRDSLTFAFGWVGIAYQQWTHSVSIPLLIVYGVAIGLPGVAALLSALSDVTESRQASSAQVESSSSSA